MMVDDRYEELKLRARLRHEKQTRAIFAKKKREGYLYWCPAISDNKNHRVYFRSLESAEHWITRLKKAGVDGDIHSLDEEVIW